MLHLLNINKIIVLLILQIYLISNINLAEALAPVSSLEAEGKEIKHVMDELEQGKKALETAPQPKSGIKKDLVLISEPEVKSLLKSPFDKLRAIRQEAFINPNWIPGRESSLRANTILNYKQSKIFFDKLIFYRALDYFINASLLEKFYSENNQNKKLNFGDVELEIRDLKRKLWADILKYSNEELDKIQEEAKILKDFKGNELAGNLINFVSRLDYMESALYYINKDNPENKECIETGNKLLTIRKNLIDGSNENNILDYVIKKDKETALKETVKKYVTYISIIILIITQIIIITNIGFPAIFAYILNFIMLGSAIGLFWVKMPQSNIKKLLKTVSLALLGVSILLSLTTIIFGIPFILLGILHIPAFLAGIAGFINRSEEIHTRYKIARQYAQKFKKIEEGKGWRGKFAELLAIIKIYFKEQFLGDKSGAYDYEAKIKERLTRIGVIYRNKFDEDVRLERDEEVEWLAVNLNRYFEYLGKSTLEVDKDGNLTEGNFFYQIIGQVTDDKVNFLLSKFLNIKDILKITNKEFIELGSYKLKTARTILDLYVRYQKEKKKDLTESTKVIVKLFDDYFKDEAIFDKYEIKKDVTKDIKKKEIDMDKISTEVSLERTLRAKWIIAIRFLLVLAVAILVPFLGIMPLSLLYISTILLIIASLFMVRKDLTLKANIFIGIALMSAVFAVILGPMYLYVFGAFLLIGPVFPLFILFAVICILILTVFQIDYFLNEIRSNNVNRKVRTALVHGRVMLPGLQMSEEYVVSEKENVEKLSGILDQYFSVRGNSAFGILFNGSVQKGHALYRLLGALDEKQLPLLIETFLRTHNILDIPENDLLKLDADRLKQAKLLICLFFRAKKKRGSDINQDLQNKLLEKFKNINTAVSAEKIINIKESLIPEDLIFKPEPRTRILGNILETIIHKEKVKKYAIFEMLLRWVMLGLVITFAILFFVDLWAPSLVFITLNLVFILVFLALSYFNYPELSVQKRIVLLTTLFFVALAGLLGPIPLILGYAIPFGAHNISMLIMGPAFFITVWIFAHKFKNDFFAQAMDVKLDNKLKSNYLYDDKGHINKDFELTSLADYTYLAILLKDYFDKTKEPFKEKDGVIVKGTSIYELLGALPAKNIDILFNKIFEVDNFLAYTVNPEDMEKLKKAHKIFEMYLRIKKERGEEVLFAKAEPIAKILDSIEDNHKLEEFLNNNFTREEPVKPKEVKVLPAVTAELAVEEETKKNIERAKSLPFKDYFTDRTDLFKTLLESKNIGEDNRVHYFNVNDLFLETGVVNVDLLAVIFALQELGKEVKIINPDNIVIDNILYLVYDFLDDQVKAKGVVSIKELDDLIITDMPTGDYVYYNILDDKSIKSNVYDLSEAINVDLNQIYSREISKSA